MIVCPRCGKQNEQGRVFCWQCSFNFLKVRQERERQAASTQSPPQPSDSPDRLQDLHQLIEKNIHQSQHLPEHNIPPQPSPVSVKHPATSSTNYIWPILGGLALILIAAAIYFFWGMNNNPIDDSSTLYRQAEEFYTQGNYVEALQSYQLFTERHTDDPLIQVVENRIDDIYSRLNANSTRRKEAGDLLIKAQMAYSEGIYIFPDSTSAVFYINELLKVAPGHATAVELQQRIINSYDKAGREAIRSGDYTSAITHYETILQILPGDTYAKGRLTRLDELIGQKTQEESLAAKEAELRRRERELAVRQARQRRELERQREAQRQLELAARNKPVEKIPDPPRENLTAGAVSPSPESSSNIPSSSNVTPKPSPPVNQDNSVVSNEASLSIRKSAVRPDQLKYLNGLQPATPALGAALLVKVAAMEKGISGNPDPIVIYVLGDDQMADALKAAIGKRVGASKIARIQTGTRLPASRPHILYVGNPAQADLARIYSHAKKVLTASANPAVTREGVTLGFGVGQNSKPQILINRASSKAEGCLWYASINSIATFFN